MKLHNILLIFTIVVLGSQTLFSQNSFRVVLRDHDTKEALVGATAQVRGSMRGASSDANGVILLEGIANGKQTLVFNYLGYETLVQSFGFPIEDSTSITILLKRAQEEELEEVQVISTRSSRNIDNVPTRMEAISGEELEEKGNMKPGDIRMLLNESTGIQTQQTSATSYNSSIRIQGLDGKYTQILKDGLPLYGGFSGGLSLLQIAPLDLKQVEVIKGASSTLYGGGAIAGLVNLVSKTPEEERELSAMLNATSALGVDASVFYAQRFDRVGTTVFAGYNLGTAYDPADIGLTAIPEFKRYTINPKLFLYPTDRLTMCLGFNTTVEDRTGGDLEYIKGNASPTHSYFERNQTTRVSALATVDYKPNDNSAWWYKNSVSFYDRTLSVPNFVFAGAQLSTFGELGYSHQNAKLEWIAGLNLWTDKFEQQDVDLDKRVDYEHTTIGAFVQNTWKAHEKFTLESGLRADYQNAYGLFLLPRISALLQLSPKLALRLGGGLGYKTPTVFTEDAERQQFRNVLPIDAALATAEESIGGNFDLNYRTALSEEVSLAVNTLFFYTQVTNPLLLTATEVNTWQFVQPTGFIDTKGVEANVKLSYGDWKLFLGYTLADVKQHYGTETTDYPLVAKQRLNNVLMYEVEESWKIGLEAYYFSTQILTNGESGQNYWLFGFMVEKIWEHFSLFINFENLGDTRQTKFGSIYTGSITSPEFKDIYAPVDGFVVNGGLKIRL